MKELLKTAYYFYSISSNLIQTQRPYLPPTSCGSISYKAQLSSPKLVTTAPKLQTGHPAIYNRAKHHPPSRRASAVCQSRHHRATIQWIPKLPPPTAVSLPHCGHRVSVSPPHPTVTHPPPLSTITKSPLSSKSDLESFAPASPTSQHPDVP
jgi:hypothetical protein